MNKFRLRVLLFSLFILQLISSTSFISISNAFSNKTISIKATDVQWPPSHYSWDNHSLFSFSVKFEINNFGTKKRITTSTSCLLYPFMIANLSGFYKEYESSICLMVITTHAINSGISNRSIGYSFEILNYNKSSPPPGNITFWAKLYSETHSFELLIYKTFLCHFENGSYYFQTSLLDILNPISKIKFYQSIPIAFMALILVYFYRRKSNKH